MVTTDKLLALNEMESLARDATRKALAESAYMLSDDDKRNLTLGSYLNDQYGIFDLYIARERREDAKVISRAFVDRRTGEVEVKVDPSEPLELWLVSAAPPAEGM